MQGIKSLLDPGNLMNPASCSTCPAKHAWRSGGSGRSPDKPPISDRIGQAQLRTLARVRAGQSPYLIPSVQPMQLLAGPP